MTSSGLGSTSVIFVWMQKAERSMGSWKGEKQGAVYIELPC